MKRFLVIGLGNFGSTAAASLYSLGHEVIVVDRDPDVIDRAGDHSTYAVAGDGGDRAVLDEIDARSADAAIISIGENLAASILALLAVRDLGISEIYVKVVSTEHKRIALAVGATETVFPEREAAEGLASRLTSGKLVHYVQYSDSFAIQEMAVPSGWCGKPLRELAVRERHDIQVVAVHDMLTDGIAIPDPDRPLTMSDGLLVAGAPAALSKVLEER